MTEFTTSGRGKPRLHHIALTDADQPLLEKLSAEFRQVLTATGNYGEIAMALNLPQGTVKSRLHRARAALKALQEQQAVAAE